MNENELAGSHELTDDELGKVTGGATLHMKGDKYFAYIGSSSNSDWNLSYVCPNCGKPVRYTKLGFFKCDACDEKWWFEYKLEINDKSGVWKEISREEFMHRLRPEYRQL